MAKTKATPKAEETRQAIYEAALSQFREEGFESATMRDIARKAGVATGAAYYYYPSKESIVMEFYRRSCAAMQPQIAEALQGKRGLESRLRELIRVKLEHFSPNRAVLRALLRNEVSAVAVQRRHQRDSRDRYCVVREDPGGLRDTNTGGPAA